MEYIDMQNWRRREHFDFFYRMDYPQYNICADIDITRFLLFTREKKLSFYYSMIYAVTRIVNDCQNFKYRIHDGKVVLHNMIHPSFTQMDNNTEEDLFKMLTTDFNYDISLFVKEAEDECERQEGYFDSPKLVGRDDLIYITCIPWISFTHISHTISLKRDDAVPRISWGKYYTREGRILLPFSVQVHHALVDGFHVGQYITRLQTFLNDIE